MHSISFNMHQEKRIDRTWVQRYHFDALCYNLIIIAGSSNLANHVVIENMKSENRKLTQKVKSGIQYS